MSRMSVAPNHHLVWIRLNFIDTATWPGGEAELMVEWESVPRIGETIESREGSWRVAEVRWALIDGVPEVVLENVSHQR